MSPLALLASLSAVLLAALFLPARTQPRRIPVRVRRER